jgi:phosphomannomutase
MPITDEKLQKFERLLAHVIEQAQKHHFMNALYTLAEANLLLLKAQNDVLKAQLVGWGRGTMRLSSTEPQARP